MHVVRGALPGVVHDMEDRYTSRPRAGEQARRLRQRGFDTFQPHDALTVGVLAVDHDQRGLPERRRLIAQSHQIPQGSGPCHVDRLLRWVPGVDASRAGAGCLAAEGRCVRTSPRIKLDRGRDRPPARQPRHKVADIVRSVHPFRQRGQEHGQLPRDVVLRPVGRLVAQAEIDVVHLSLAQPPHRAGSGRPVVIAAQLGVRPPGRRAAIPCQLQPALSSVQVGDDVNRGPSCPFVDFAVSLRGPAGVARYILSPECSLEPPDVSVGVTRQMRQHVRNRPPGQPARRANLLVGDVLHPRDQPRVCGPAQLDRRSGIGVQITRHSLQPPTRHQCAVSHSVCQLAAMRGPPSRVRTVPAWRDSCGMLPGRFTPRPWCPPARTLATPVLPGPARRRDLAVSPA